MACWWKRFPPWHKCKKHISLKGCRKLEKILKLPKVSMVSGRTRNRKCRQLPPTQIALSHAAAENPRRRRGDWLTHAQLILSLSIWDVKFLTIHEWTSPSSSSDPESKCQFTFLTWGMLVLCLCVFTQSDSQRTPLECDRWKMAECKEESAITELRWSDWGLCRHH